MLPRNYNYGRDIGQIGTHCEFLKSKDNELRVL